jgi:hypothetical protein
VGGGDMVAFEISVNGHHIRTIGATNFGSLVADIMWSRTPTNAGPIIEDTRAMFRGLDGESLDAMQWPHIPLRVGDAVTVRIIEASGECDPPSERTTTEED